MQQMITAVFEGGMLKPDERVNLAEHAHVRVIVESLETLPATVQDALGELDRLCEESPICSTGPRLTARSIALTRGNCCRSIPLQLYFGCTLMTTIHAQIIGDQALLPRIELERLVEMARRANPSSRKRWKMTSQCAR